jgi:peptide/nickel transport system permease protein
MDKRMTLKSLLRSSVHLRLGLILLVLIAVLALLAPVLQTYDPYSLGNDLKAPPGKSHLLGTDGLGGDVFSMILEGSRTSLLVGFTAAFISGILGTLIGGAAGYLGGTADRIISEIINIFLMLPTFFLVLITVALFGSSMLNIMVIIGLTSWPGNARLMRVQAMSLKERTFVKSAKVLGESGASLLFRYIIPNGIFPVVANTAMGIAGAILTEASLSFLGLGDPNIISWGQMVFAGRAYMTSAWWVATFPGIAILITVVAFYLLCDGLNAAFNPRNLERR